MFLAALPSLFVAEVVLVVLPLVVILVDFKLYRKRESCYIGGHVVDVDVVNVVVL